MRTGWYLDVDSTGNGIACRTLSDVDRMGRAKERRGEHDRGMVAMREARDLQNWICWELCVCSKVCVTHDIVQNTVCGVDCVFRTSSDM